LYVPNNEQIFEPQRHEGIKYYKGFVHLRVLVSLWFFFAE
jgi:hypothetical protein